MSESIVTIHNIQDLNRILSIQTIMARRARMDLNAITDTIPPPTNQVEEDQAAVMIFEKSRTLLQRYARLPTLTEYAAIPNRDQPEQYGATFCVAVLVGEMVLLHIREQHEVFHKQHRKLVTLLLRELECRRGDELVETMKRAVRINLTDSGLNEAERNKLLDKMMRTLIEVMILVLCEYGIVESLHGGYKLTTTGRRVLRHMQDAQRFMDLVLEAHERLQNSAEVVSLRKTPAV